MNTELYMENYRVDISKDISALLTFALDDLKDFSARSTTWSKTIVLPGTANNNKVFGHIFQVGQSNAANDLEDNVGYNFNASKAADIILFQDQMQTFKGVLRLLQINIYQGRPEYEVSLFGKLAGLNVALSSRLLENLDFSAYDHVFNTTNIIASWDNTPGSGYYYPLIDYGTYSTNKHDWDIRTFRPALYVRDYIDKMITEAGFRWSSDLFNNGRFKRLVVPHNQKKLQRSTSTFVTASVTSDKFVIDHDGDPEASPLDFSSMTWDTASTASNFTNLGPNIGWQYNQPGSINARIRVTVTGYVSAGTEGFTAYIGIAKNLTTSPIPPDWTVKFTEYITVTNSGGPPTPYTHTFDILINLAENDTFEVFAATPTGGGGGASYVMAVQSASLIVDSQSATLVDVNVGDTVGMNVILPKNVRQIDFLVSIVKLFNLYCWEDKHDSSLIYFKPYIEYYTTDNSYSADWSYKLNRDKAIKIKPMSELNAKKYEFKYKSDSDYYNELYRKRYGLGYGDYIFDSQFEFAEQTKAFELVFSATPLVGVVGEEKVWPTIFKRTGPDNAPVEENVDSNIRIMQSKKITGVASWDIKNASTVLSSVTDYGYAGHYDDPDAPTNDLNFGVVRELFFVLLTGAINVTQFNVYWSGYMAEITDKDSKLLTANFYLTPKDIYDLDFARYVYLDGVLFRLNKIKDYNASKPMDVVCELLKVNYTLYTETPVLEVEDYLLWTDDEPLLNDGDSPPYILYQ